MKLVIQNYKLGELKIGEVPPPSLRPGGVVVRNVNSMISGETEKMGFELAQKSLAGKAKERPDIAVMGRLDIPLALGYSKLENGNVLSKK